MTRREFIDTLTGTEGPMSLTNDLPEPSAVRAAVGRKWFRLTYQAGVTGRPDSVVTFRETAVLDSDGEHRGDDDEEIAQIRAALFAGVAVQIDEKGDWDDISKGSALLVLRAAILALSHELATAKAVFPDEAEDHERLGTLLRRCKQLLRRYG